MKSAVTLTPTDWVMQSLYKNGFGTYNEYEGRLMLVELLVKAAAGFYNSSTEEGYMSEFRMLKKDRTLNKHGRMFICSMLYKHSNNKSDFCIYSEIHRG